MNPSSSLYEFFNINQMAHQIIICKLEAERNTSHALNLFFSFVTSQARAGC